MFFFEKKEPKNFWPLLCAAGTAGDNQVSTAREQDRKLAARLLRRADILIDRGRHAAALEACREGIAADPGLVELYRRAGAVALLMGQASAACDALEIALSLGPADAAVLCNLGTALRELGRPEEARAKLEACLRMDSRVVSAWFNLGLVFADMAMWAEAVRCHARALAGAPRHDRAAGALSMALLAAGRAEEAAEVARQAITWAPAPAALHICLSAALLMQGRLAEGWREDQWRWMIPEVAATRRHAEIPVWTGGALAGRRLLLVAEQGYGDTLQMCRYASRIQGAGSIVFEVPGPLVRLFGSLEGPLEIVRRGDTVPAVDVQCPTMSLPFACGTAAPADVPGHVPYLRALPEDVAVWRQRLAGVEGLRVGLCWTSGLRTQLVNRLVQMRKSIPLATLAPLGGVAGCSFISLQTGEAAADVRGGPPGLLVHDFSAAIGDFADTAALIACLDLVVTVDTAVAHLAGALGAEVWLLNRYDADWRWATAQDANPWYPTLRQFRQPTPGDWPSAVNDLRCALEPRTGYNR
jgi:tetratricopeptide (TPR) repeat protein